MTMMHSATRLSAGATETIASVPRMVADRIDADVVVFAPEGADAMMVDLYQRRSVFAAADALSQPLRSGSVSPGSNVGGYVARSVQDVRDARSGARLGVIGVYDREPREAGWNEANQLQELSVSIAGRLEDFVLDRPSPAPTRGATPLGASPLRPVEPLATSVGSAYRWFDDLPSTSVLPAPKDPTEPIAPLRAAAARAALPPRRSLDAMWQQEAHSAPTPAPAPAPATGGDADVELRRYSLSLADEIGGAADSLGSLIGQIDLRHDQVLHRHAAAVQERFAVVERSRARLRGHLEGNPERPRTRAMFELPRVIDAAVTTVYQSLPGSHVDVDLIDDSLTVSADPGMVQRAITLLLSTAVEAARHRTVRLSAGVRAEDSSRIEGRLSVQLNVSFNGEQLTAGQLAQLAGRFADACRAPHTSDRRTPAQMRVTTHENVLVADSFEVRSGTDSTTFVAQWPLDLG
ncbi:hypothetical protein PZ938_01060 [Luteipulveratus sp. YIM 133132]|uniref:hypothetical protein n=1 Tax=Luteipulveratus flavus TaxID=3031728 RepID=UPI0023B0E49A|nr:hypothetical protein [Luteipulveratus sp. YIM 133132]MDE9364184.1 hypothetical protein [Luteipulveratus sp. YIM 133132]